MDKCRLWFSIHKFVSTDQLQKFIFSVRAMINSSPFSWIFFQFLRRPILVHSVPIQGEDQHPTIKVHNPGSVAGSIHGRAAHAARDANESNELEGLLQWVRLAQRDSQAGLHSNLVLSNLRHPTTSHRGVLLPHSRHATEDCKENFGSRRFPQRSCQGACHQDVDCGRVVLLRVLLAIPRGLLVVRFWERQTIQVRFISPHFNLFNNGWEWGGGGGEWGATALIQSSRAWAQQASKVNEMATWKDW